MRRGKIEEMVQVENIYSYIVYYLSLTKTGPSLFETSFTNIEYLKIKSIIMYSWKSPSEF